LVERYESFDVFDPNEDFFEIIIFCYMYLFTLLFQICALQLITKTILKSNTILFHIILVKNRKIIKQTLFFILLFV